MQHVGAAQIWLRNLCCSFPNKIENVLRNATAIANKLIRAMRIELMWNCRINSGKVRRINEYANTKPRVNKPKNTKYGLFCAGVARNLNNIWHDRKITNPVDGSTLQNVNTTRNTQHTFLQTTCKSKSKSHPTCGPLSVTKASYECEATRTRTKHEKTLSHEITKQT